MRIYRVEFLDSEGYSRGYSWYSNLKLANRDANEWRREEKDRDAHMMRLDFTRTTTGILEMLNNFASRSTK